MTYRRGLYPLGRAGLEPAYDPATGQWSLLKEIAAYDFIAANGIALADFPTLVEDLRGANPDLMLASYLMPLTWTTWGRKPDSWARRHHDLIERCRAWMPATYTNVDLRRMDIEALVGLLEDASVALMVPAMLDCVPSYLPVDGSEREKDAWRWAYHEFAMLAADRLGTSLGTMDPLWINDGGKAVVPGVSFFVEHVDGLDPDDVLTNPINGLLTNPRPAPIIFSATDGASVDKELRLYRVTDAMASLCDGISVVGPSDGNPELKPWDQPDRAKYDFGALERVRHPWPSLYIGECEGGTVVLNTGESRQRVPAAGKLISVDAHDAAFVAKD
jgi:hypothetical protein